MSTSSSLISGKRSAGFHRLHKGERVVCMCIRAWSTENFCVVLQQREKVVYLENLAVEFNLKTQVCLLLIHVLLVANDSG